MITYKKMNEEEFADLLCGLHENETVEFACEFDEETPDKDFEMMDLHSWYYAKVYPRNEYDTRFLLIDYCGGEEAYAIPLNNYSDKMDDDDIREIHERVKNYFRNENWRLFNGGSVVVEFKEEN